MTTDVRDAALQAACPVVPVPRFGPPSSACAGQRVLVASNGVFLEVTRTWLRCVLKLAELPAAPPLPYGIVKEHLSFEFGVIPLRLLDEFIEHGRLELPNEVAGALVYSKRTGTLRLVIHEALQASPASIRYRMDGLLPDEEVAVDLHTHGRLEAFWSATDDADDQGVKVCGVFGDLHKPRPSAAFRLAVNGCFLPLPHPWGGKSCAEPALDLSQACPTLASMGFTSPQLWNT